MFKTVLFDLDGTLLDIDMNIFLRQYFKKMMIMAKDFGFDNIDNLAEQVYKSTDIMIGDRNLRTTNKEVFMQDFFANWDYSPQEFIPFFDYFYERGFPQLKEYCKPFAGIPEMMKTVFEKIPRIVIATNAVFPLSALQNRLQWAGVGDFNYSLITSYEIMHACKPHVEYYQEIAGKLGVNPQECLMVGNDMGEDLTAARIGMKTFLVEDRLINKDIDVEPDYRGSLRDLYSFFESL